MATKPYVFISYAHRNNDLVLPAIQALQAGNVELWYDNGIEAGSEWPEYVAEKVANCDKFVLFVSNAYLESQNCKRELNFAISRKKDILSIYLEEVQLSPGMEMQLGTYQAIFRNRFPGNQQFYAALPREAFFNSCKNIPQSAPASTDSQSVPPTDSTSFGQTSNQATNFGPNVSTPVGGGGPTSQLPKRNKIVAIVLAILLGGFGAHNFYLRKPLIGVLHLCFFWTPFSLVVALVEAFFIYRMSDADFEQKFRCKLG